MDKQRLKINNKDTTLNNHRDDREEKIRSIFLAAPVGIGMVASRVILEANETLCQMTGYFKEGLIGRDSSFLYPTMDEYNYAGREKSEQIRRNGIGTVETRWIKKDGSIIDVLLSAAPLDRNDMSKGITFTAIDITEKKKYEEKIRQYSASVKRIADKIPGMLYQYNATGSARGFAYISEKAAGVFGIDINSPDYITEFIRHIHPDYTTFFIRSTEYAIANRSGWTCEWPFIHASGETRWYRGISKTEDENGELVYYGVIQDITEEKEARTALISSKSKYRELVELAVDGILLASNDGLISGMNSQLEKITGRSRDQLTGLHIGELFTGESLKAKPLRLDLLKNGEILINERVLMREDGIPLIVETHSKMMPDGAFQAIFRDITERKRTEEALASEKERLAVTLRSIGDGVIATDRAGNILLMNSVAETLTGWKSEECAGKKLNDIFIILNEFTKEAKTDIINRVLFTGDVVELAEEIILVSRNGSEILISDSAAPIKDSDGTVTGVVIVFRDITEKRKLAESLQRTQKLDSLATLAGGIAHDFNNMLGGMLGYIDLARNYSKRAEDTAAYLDKAMTVFDKAKNLTGQLMTFARGGAPSLKTESIVPVLKDFSLSALSGSDTKCTFTIQDDLWLTGFDRGQIGQVIYNIVANARDFMGTEGSISVSAENISIGSSNPGRLKPGRYIKVEITDSGQGIPNDMLPHIFDPFFTTKKKGNGLGLSTAYSIIQRHGGSIDVESSYGKGSRFWFYLPAVLPTVEEHSSHETSTHKGSGIILIMDDEYFIREITYRMLEHMGYNTLQASGGVEMLELYREYKDNPELRCMILDLTIPDGMGGRETVAEIRKLNREIPVFASSGYSNDRIMANPDDYGFTDSIRKPFTINEFSVLLNRHLKA